MLLKVLTIYLKCSIIILSNEGRITTMELNINDFVIPFEELLKMYEVEESEVVE